VRQTLSVSERRVCRTLGQHRSTQRKVPCGLPNEERLTEDIIALTKEFGRYGYRMITGMLNNSGWHVNHKRVERIWRREGAKRPTKTAEEGSALAERRFIRPAAAGASEPCLVL
jgi:putative transposase